MRAYMHICTHICIYACVYVYIRAYTDIYAHIFVYTRKYAYMHAFLVSSSYVSCSPLSSAWPWWPQIRNSWMNQLPVHAVYAARLRWDYLIKMEEMITQALYTVMEVSRTPKVFSLEEICSKLRAKAAQFVPSRREAVRNEIPQWRLMHSFYYGYPDMDCTVSIWQNGDVA